LQPGHGQMPTAAGDSQSPRSLHHGHRPRVSSALTPGCSPASLPRTAPELYLRLQVRAFRPSHHGRMALSGGLARREATTTMHSRSVSTQVPAPCDLFRANAAGRAAS
jgi:hypothetical protein